MADFGETAVQDRNSSLYSGCFCSFCIHWGMIQLMY